MIQMVDGLFPHCMVDLICPGNVSDILPSCMVLGDYRQFLLLTLFSKLL